MAENNLTPPAPEGLNFDDYYRVVASWVEKNSSAGPYADFSEATSAALQARRAADQALKKYFPTEYAAYVSQTAEEETAFADVSEVIRSTANMPDAELPPTTTPSSAGDIIASEPPSTTSTRSTTTAGSAERLYSHPPRVISGASPGGGGGSYQYTGPGLVGIDGTVLRDEQGQIKYYDPETDPQTVWASYSPEIRAKVLNDLYQRGFYSSAYKPGNYRGDLSAIALWLESANYAGVTKERFLTEMPTVESRPSGGGIRVRYSSPDDLKVVARKVSQNTLGRELSDPELDRFVQSFQSLERQYQTGSASSMPDVSVTAEKFSREVAPTEANAYEYLGYMNQLFSSIGVG
jgi:hypothetical protein